MSIFPPQALSGSQSASDHRMTAERCARLMLVAVAHRLEEAWMVQPPVLALMYAGQYLPTISKRVAGLIGQEGAQKMRDSKTTVKSD